MNFHIFTCKNLFLYINTSEIPAELSNVNMISSHVKITCLHVKMLFSEVKRSPLLWLHNP